MEYKTLIKKIIKRLTPFFIKNVLLEDFITQNQFMNESYSQEGEDILLERLLYGKENGFYVDIGAHHPMRFSNTYKFYKKGWSGINVEPNPEVIELFNLLRPRDINLNFGISNEEGNLSYHRFQEPALNTFSDKIKNKRIDENSSPYLGEMNVPTMKLSNLLSEHKRHFDEITFLTIDTEGFDLEVLQSNDWTCFKPLYILVEDLRHYNLLEINQSAVVQFLKERGYDLVSKLSCSLLFSFKKSNTQKP